LNIYPWHINLPSHHSTSPLSFPCHFLLFQPIHFFPSKPLNFLSSNWKNVNMSSNLPESKEFCLSPSSPLIPFFFPFFLFVLLSLKLNSLCWILWSSLLLLMSWGFKLNPLHFSFFFPCKFPLSFLFFYLSSCSHCCAIFLNSSKFVAIIASSSIYNFHYFELDLSSLFWVSCIIISLSFSYQLLPMFFCFLFVIVASSQPIISTLCLILPMCKMQA